MVIAQNLIGRPSAFRTAAFHEALEIGGAMLAGKMAVSGAFGL
jgi:hypothetical protein